jgi:hypothetical protein
LRVGALSRCGEAALRRKQRRLSIAPRELPFGQHHRCTCDLLSSQDHAWVFDGSRRRPQRAAGLLERTFGVLRVFSCLELAKLMLKLGSLRPLCSIVGYAGSRGKKAGKPTENETDVRRARAAGLTDT